MVNFNLGNDVLVSNRNVYHFFSISSIQTPHNLSVPALTLSGLRASSRVGDSLWSPSPPWGLSWARRVTSQSNSF